MRFVDSPKPVFILVSLTNTTISFNCGPFNDGREIRPSLYWCSFRTHQRTKPCDVNSPPLPFTTHSLRRRMMKTTSRVRSPHPSAEQQRRRPPPFDSIRPHDGRRARSNHEENAISRICHTHLAKKLPFSLPIDNSPAKSRPTPSPIIQ